MKPVPLNYETTPRPRKWFLSHWILGLLVLLGFAWVYPFPYWQHKTEVCSTTGDIRVTKTYFGLISRTPTVSPTALSAELKRRNIAYTTNWRHLSTSYGSYGMNRTGVACAPAPPVHALGRMPGTCLRVLPDAALRSFLDRISSADQEEQSAAVEALHSIAVLNLQTLPPPPPETPAGTIRP